MDNQLREHRAKALVDNPLFQEAFEILREDLMSRWNNSGSADLQARESIWLAMRLLDRIHGHVTAIIETGHMNKILDEQHPLI